jgi:hypothetical protein
LEVLICDGRTILLEMPAAQAPAAGERLTRHDVHGLDDTGLITALEHAAWEVVEVVPIEDWPGRMKVYARPAEPVESSWGGAGVPPL